MKKKTNEEAIIPFGERAATVGQKVKAFSDMLAKLAGILHSLQRKRSDYMLWHTRQTLAGYIKPLTTKYPGLVEEIAEFIETISVEDAANGETEGAGAQSVADRGDKNSRKIGQ